MRGRRESRARPARLRLPTVRRYRLVKARDQFIRVEWLTKRAHRSGPVRTRADRLFLKGGHDDHGQGSAACDQVILSSKPLRPGICTSVIRQAVSFNQPEPMNSSAESNVAVSISERPHKALRGVAHRLVVINNRNHRNPCHEFSPACPFGRGGLKTDASSDAFPLALGQPTRSLPFRRIVRDGLGPRGRGGRCVLELDAAVLGDRGLLDGVDLLALQAGGVPAVSVITVQQEQRRPEDDKTLSSWSPPCHSCGRGFAHPMRRRPPLRHAAPRALAARNEALIENSARRMTPSPSPAPGRSRTRKRWRPRRRAPRTT